MRRPGQSQEGVEGYATLTMPTRRPNTEVAQQRGIWQGFRKKVKGRRIFCDLICVVAERVCIFGISPLKTGLVL
jgi:hypothetical protein